MQGVIWLLLVTGAQGRLACKEDYRYAISATNEIGLLGAGGLTTTWKEYSHDLQLNDGTIKAICVAGSFKVTALNVVSRRYLASLHKGALLTSVTFELLFDGTNPSTEEMGDDFGFGLCPFDTSPVVKGKYNTTLLNGSAFYLVCPIGWTGVIECTAVSPTTLRTEVVKTFRRENPFPHRMDCVTTTVENEDLFYCKLGGNWTCVKGEPVVYTGGQVKQCKWCGFDFNEPDGLPHYPIGKCILANETGYRIVDSTDCNRDGVVISAEGSHECLIGNTTVKVHASDERLGPMPCRPKEIVSSAGPVRKTSCTFNYAKTLKNKYYEPRDSYFQQYMLKGEYQYWFDLDVHHHHHH